MNISIDGLYLLSTRHANSYESAQLRIKLLAEGYHFCSVCKTIQPSEDFPRQARGRGGRAARCKRCSYRTKARKTGYVPHGPRPIENSARYREAHPTMLRERGRLWAAAHYVPSDTPRPGPMTPETKRASKRRNFDQRKALGMSGRQANYMATAPEFDESWNAIKR